MSKIVFVNIGKWKGSVVIADPLTQAQAHAIEAAVELPILPEIEELKDKLQRATEAFGADSEQVKTLEQVLSEIKVGYSYTDDAQLPAIMACVEQWNIENFTPDPFPFSPRKQAHELIALLFKEISIVYMGELEIPNA